MHDTDVYIPVFLQEREGGSNKKSAETQGPASLDYAEENKKTLFQE